MAREVPLKTGLLLGASAALLWAVARRYAPEDDQRMVDWDLATRVAVRTSAHAVTLHPAARHRLTDEYRAMLRDIEQPIADYTRTSLSLADTTVRVMDRHEWIDANVSNFRGLFEPLEEIYAARARWEPLDLIGVTRATRALLSAQVGVLLGFLARRVVGQYDVNLLGREPLQGGQLYFVEPNIQWLQQQLRVPADEVRAWIALHEATHAHEFEVNPWVRDYMNNTLQSYLRTVADDLRGRAGARGGSFFLNRLGNNLLHGKSLMEAMMTPHQRQLLSRLQSLMTLAEGYSNNVMHNVGRRLLSHYEDIKVRVEHRQRRRGPIERLFLRLTGLSLKMEQYALGEAFVDRVVTERGIAFMNQAWAAPENLPTEAEFRAPEQWIKRMDLRS